MISLPFPSMTAASLHTVGHGCRVPLRVESGGKTVEKSGGGKTLCPWVDTHRSPASALFQRACEKTK